MNWLDEPNLRSYGHLYKDGKWFPVTNHLEGLAEYFEEAADVEKYEELLKRGLAEGIVRQLKDDPLQAIIEIEGNTDILKPEVVARMAKKLAVLDDNPEAQMGVALADDPEHDYYTGPPKGYARWYRDKLLSNRQPRIIDAISRKY